MNCLVAKDYSPTSGVAKGGEESAFLALKLKLKFRRKQALVNAICITSCIHHIHVQFPGLHQDTDRRQPSRTCQDFSPSCFARMEGPYFPLPQVDHVHFFLCVRKGPFSSEISLLGASPTTTGFKSQCLRRKMRLLTRSEI